MFGNVESVWRLSLKLLTPANTQPYSTSPVIKSRLLTVTATFFLLRSCDISSVTLLLTVSIWSFCYPYLFYDLSAFLALELNFFNFRALPLWLRLRIVSILSFCSSLLIEAYDTFHINANIQIHFYLDRDWNDCSSTHHFTGKCYIEGNMNQFTLNEISNLAPLPLETGN